MTAENHRATDRHAQRRLDLAQITNMIFIHIRLRRQGGGLSQAGDPSDERAGPAGLHW